MACGEATVAEGAFPVASDPHPSWAAVLRPRRERGLAAPAAKDIDRRDFRRTDSAAGDTPRGPGLSLDHPGAASAGGPRRPLIRSGGEVRDSVTGVENAAESTASGRYFRCGAEGVSGQRNCRPCCACTRGKRISSASGSLPSSDVFCRMTALSWTAHITASMSSVTPPRRTAGRLRAARVTRLSTRLTRSGYWNDIRYLIKASRVTLFVRNTPGCGARAASGSRDQARMSPMFSSLRITCWAQ